MYNLVNVMVVTVLTIGFKRFLLEFKNGLGFTFNVDYRRVFPLGHEPKYGNATCIFCLFYLMWNYHRVAILIMIFKLSL